MRPLLTDPTALTPGLYQRFVRRAQLAGFLADHLYRGEPYLALNAVVLDPADHRLLSALTETFARAFDRAARALAGDVAALQEMGFPWVAAELLHAEEPRLPPVGRFDFVRDRSGHWWLLEYNADTPSGIREAIVADRLVHRLRPEARPLSRPGAGLGTALIEHVGCLVRDLPTVPVLGIVTDASELEDLSQMAFTRALLQKPLERQGVEVVLADLDNLRASRGGLLLGNRRVGGLYRYFPFESMLGRPAFSAIFEAVTAGQLRLLNGLFGLLLQHKGLMAWLWEHRADPLFPPAERAAIARYLPPTWPLTRAPATGDGNLVVKQVFGREGEEVFFAADLTPAQLGELRQRRTYVAQQRIEVEELEAVVMTSVGPAVWRGHATVGSFAVGGRWAGYYTRFGPRIITARAKWLATLVSPAAPAPRRHFVPERTSVSPEARNRDGEGG